MLLKCYPLCRYATSMSNQSILSSLHTVTESDANLNITNHISNTVEISSPYCSIQYVNPAFKKLTGFEPGIASVCVFKIQLMFPPANPLDELRFTTTKYM